MPQSLRLGLCCIFVDEPIKFRTTTAKYLSKLGQEAGRSHRDALVKHNLKSLETAIRRCKDLGIGAFRITSTIVPLATHPDWLFDVERLADGPLGDQAEQCRRSAQDLQIRLSMHPDQFVVLSTKRNEVAAASLAELEYQGAFCAAVGADVMNIHGGGGYGDKPSAMGRFVERVDQLTDRARSRLTIENDDRTYTPLDLLKLCERTGLPLVYDVHHHRCNADDMSVSEATAAALKTWNREPHFHISSPRNGWDSKDERSHHDYIDVNDFPNIWRTLDAPLTVDVEAKAKELAVKRLAKELSSPGCRAIAHAAPL
jgi:UV DNA damage endonuclease